ncbi:MAG: hypothetical protein WD557_12645 [Dehalococcoidia bacterium]
MRRRILILGLPYFGKLLGEVLNARGWEARYHEHPGRDVRRWARLAPLVARADLIYLISSRIERRSPQAVLAALRRRPMIIHWVGTDVLFARDEHLAGRSSERLKRQATHLADAPWLVDELAELGIEAEYVPLPVPSLHTGDPPPLPATFRVLLYYPVDPIDREVFDWDAMLGLATAFPDVQFQLVPSPPETLPGPLPPNLTARGWVRDVDALYRDTTVYVRLTAHDGTSFMAVESLSRGRYVIWTFPLSGAIQARGFEAVSATLRELWERHQRGELELNEAGRAAALTDFDPDRLAGDLDARLREALGVSPRPTRAP